MSIMAIGNFDGVHIGHAFLLKKTAEIAGTINTESVAMTFNEHPRNVLGKEKVLYLTDKKYKESLIKACGINKVVFVEFDKAFAEKTTVEFLTFLKELGCTQIVCGENFKFGKNAAYDTSALQAASETFGMKGHVIKLAELDKTVSSTNIRNFLLQGDVKSAEKMLGRMYSVKALVIQGHHLGTGIGFPTINQFPPEGILIPMSGVYSTLVEFCGQLYPAITNIGRRPTVEESGIPNIETHILNVDINLYGKEIRIFFEDYLRTEKKFKNLEELRRQIELDKMHVLSKYGINSI